MKSFKLFIPLHNFYCAQRWGVFLFFQKETDVQTTVDWFRIEKYLFQWARSSDGHAQVMSIVEKLKALYSISGEFSRNRSMLISIAGILFAQKEEEVCVLAPCCPDYTHDGNKYTFKGLNGGVSLLAQRQIAFLKQVQEILPAANMILLIADQEADDEAICCAVKKGKEKFLELVRQSIQETEKMVKPMGWRAVAMTEYAPCLREYQSKYELWISDPGEFGYRIDFDTSKRQDMYQQITPGCSFSEMRKRTVRTAAQYVALGRFAAERRAII